MADTETRTTMRAEIVDLATRLFQSGIPAEAVAEEMLLTAVGVMAEASGAEAVVARLERLVEIFKREADDVEAPRHH